MTEAAIEVEYVIAILIGTPEQIRSGQGYPAVTASQAAARLGISEARFRQIVGDGLIRPRGRFAKANLFFEEEVEGLRRSRTVIEPAKAK